MPPNPRPTFHPQRFIGLEYSRTKMTKSCRFQNAEQRSNRFSSVNFHFCVFALTWSRTSVTFGDGGRLLTWDGIYSGGETHANPG